MTKRMCVNCEHFMETSGAMMPSQTHKGKYTIVATGDCRVHHSSHQELPILATYKCADWKGSKPC